MGACASQKNSPIPQVQTVKIVDEEGPVKRQSVLLASKKYVQTGFFRKYKLQEPISMSENLYKVNHSTLQQIIAAKIILEKEVTDISMAKYLFIHSNVHPNILQVHDIFLESDHYYLLHPYCLGGNLMDFLTANGEICEQKASEITRSILYGLAFLHQHGVTHRSLTAKTVLFPKTLGRSQIVLNLVGNPQKVKDRSSRPVHHNTYYKAPEVITKKLIAIRDLQKQDIWSCGVILYLLLSGQLPFNGKTESTVQNEIQKGVVSFSSQEWQDVSYEAKSLVLSMLTYHEDKRPTAQTLLKNKWFSAHHHPKRIDPFAFQQLKKYNAKHHLQLATLQFMTQHLSSSSDKNKILTLFESLDENHDSLITKEELINGMKLKLGPDQAALFVEEIYDKLDKDGSGNIDYNEFALACTNKKKLLSEENLRKAFHAFDLDGNGYLSKNELKDLFYQLHMEKVDVNQVMIDVDTSGDGKISFEEFKTKMLQINTR